MTTVTQKETTSVVKINKKDIRRFKQDLLKKPRIKEQADKAIQPIVLSNLSYQAKGIILRQFRSVDITASAIENISSRNANFDKVEEILMSSIQKTVEEMKKELLRLTNLAESMGFVDPCLFSSPDAIDKNETTIYAGSPISVNYAKLISQFNQIVEISSRLRINGMFSKKQRDEVIATYNRKLKNVANMIVENADKSFFRYIQERNKTASSDS
jgi:hypothetical protein